VQEILTARGQLEAVGGIVFLSQLIGETPSASNIEYYLSIVFEKYQLRKMIQACTDVVGRIHESEGGDFLDLIGQVESVMANLARERSFKGEVPIKQLILGALNQIEAIHQNQGRLTGLPSGFADIDKMTNGLQDGEMIVFAARPSVGKTSLAMNIGEHVALDQKLPVGVFSLEMTAEALALRMLCSRARVNLRSVQNGFLSERDFPKLTGAAGKLASCGLHIDDTSGLGLLELKSKARRWHQQHGIRLVVIDYLQLMHARAENRQQEISMISSGIKELAKELRIPILVLSQLNRSIERDKKRKPRMSDLRESGQIEQDADVIAFLSQAESSDEESSDERKEACAVDLDFGKNRNGPTGTVHLSFLKCYTRFESAAKIQGDFQYN
jgi:replicative DNA helicase